MLPIAGQQRRAALGGQYQQEVDLVSLFKDVAHYVHMASDPAQVRHLVDRAMCIAQERRAVTCIILPTDIQELDAVAPPPHEHGTIHSGIGMAAHAQLPPARCMRPTS